MVHILSYNIMHTIRALCIELYIPYSLVYIFVIQFDCLPQEADKWELQRSDFQLETNIGSGNWGTVFKGFLNFTASSEAVSRHKAQMMTQGKSYNTVAIKELKGKCILI